VEGIEEKEGALKQRTTSVKKRVKKGDGSVSDALAKKVKKKKKKKK